MSPLVVLVGPPGSGKTTVATVVAERLGAAFRDTDHDVEAVEGRPVPEIFIDDGEAYFRAREHEAVVRALAEHDGVLALGGGAVLDPATRAALADHHVVFLEVGLTHAVRRVGMNANRPLLLGNVRARLKQLLDERRTLYREVATITIDTDALDADEVAERVIESIQGETRT